MIKYVTFVLAVVLLLVAGLLPVLGMLAQSIMADGRLSLDAYTAVLSSHNQWALLWNSIALSALTTLLATAIGMPLGILLGKTDLPFRRTLIVLFTIPLLIPPYIMAIAWFHLLGRGGLVARLSGGSAAAAASDLLFGLPGCVLVLSSVFMPVVMLLTMAFLKTVNPHLEEAGRNMTGWCGVLKGITTHLIFPGVLLSALLVFLLTLGEFGVPLYLRFNVYPVEVFSQFSAFYDFHAATAGAMPLAGITLLILVVERTCLRKRTYKIQLASQAGEMLRVPLGRLRGVCLLLVAMLCLLMVLLPMVVLLAAAWPLSAFPQALTQAGDSLVRSLLYAAIGASILTVVGFVCGYLIHYRALPFWLTIDSLTIFLFALPSTVTGIGLILLWNRPATNFIYATPVVIIFGLLAQYCAITSRVTASTLTQIPASMDEAAQMVGAGWARRVGFITIPLAQKGLLAGWIIAFIFCLRDMGISMMVYPPGQDTLPVQTFTLMANGPSDLVAALCMIMVLGALTPLGILAFVFKGSRSRP